MADGQKDAENYRTYKVELQKQLASEGVKSIVYNQIWRFSPSDKPPRQLTAYLIIFKEKKINNKKSLIQPQENLKGMKRCISRA